MRLIVLGTATPYPRPGNACSGYLVQGEPGAGGTDPEQRTTVWVDAGTGTLAELQRHADLDELDAIWISHRHADHSADLLVAYYALRFAELRPSRPIPLIGPEGLLERMADFLGPRAIDELPTVFDFQAMSGFGSRAIGELALSWGPVQHGVPAFGLTVDEAVEPAPRSVESAESVGSVATGAPDAVPVQGRRLAYSGDCAPCISLEEIAEDADLLLIEAGYDTAPTGADAPAHHTPEQAGRTAAAAHVGRLVLTHVAETVSGADAVRRASAAFAGDTLLARPGDVFDV